MSRKAPALCRIETEHVHITHTTDCVAAVALRLQAPLLPLRLRHLAHQDPWARMVCFIIGVLKGCRVGVLLTGAVHTKSGATAWSHMGH